MEGKPEQSHDSIRSEQVVNQIINDAIREVTTLLGDGMIARDKEMLEAVADEDSPSPGGRLIYLLQTRDAAGVSPRLKDYINQILQTLRQRLTPAEQEKFRGWGVGQNMLNEIN